MASALTQTMEQIQVTIPAGIVPGMFFQVDTRHGPMQAECPPGVEAGSAILVSVPALGALPVVTAQPLVAVGQPVEIAVHGAPIAQAMERSKMEGRMAEAKSGCYVYKPNPLCGMEFLRVSETEIMGGPCCLCGLCCCPCPTGWCGKYAPIAPRSASYKEGSSSTVLVWTSPTTYKIYGGPMNNQGDEMTWAC